MIINIVTVKIGSFQFCGSICTSSLVFIICRVNIQFHDVSIFHVSVSLSVITFIVEHLSARETFAC